MLNRILVFFLLFATTVLGQVKGTIKSTSGQPLANVSIFLKEGYTGTTSNEQGEYFLALPDSLHDHEIEIIYHILGYNTLSVKTDYPTTPLDLNISLEEQVPSFDIITSQSGEDPAYAIIRKTIGRQAENIERIDKFNADFYSRGFLKLKNIPKKVFGRPLGNLNGALKTDRSGIVYLSETFSNIFYQREKKFHENILASKVSWDDRGYSFNTARSANFSFYENNVFINLALVSPLAKYAFDYYEYKWEGKFYVDSKLVHKIKVIPKRQIDRVWEGHVFIVEDDWQLFGVDLKTTGAAIQIPVIETLNVVQGFKYDPENNFWIKISQLIDVKSALFGMEANGKFLGIYGNYNFRPVFTDDVFGNEIVSFAPDANKKGNLFWKQNRPVPLSIDERREYSRRDSLQVLMQKESYLDSIDAQRNKPTFLSPFVGYSYKNSYDNWKLQYDSFVPRINFNTVQGWNSKAAIEFKKWYNLERTNMFSAIVVAEYGLSDEHLRVYGSVNRKYNAIDKLEIGLSGGSKVSQFNLAFPITPLMNTLSSLILEKNGMKVYELNYAQIDYSQEIFNGLHLYGSLGYENRQPLFNTTDYVIFRDREKPYTSNNPLAPSDFTTGAFEEHDMVKSKIRAKINFAQKYIARPARRLNVGPQDFPELNVTFTNGISPTASHYDFTQLESSLNQSFLFGNKGRFYYLVRGGGFINGEGISFVDYRHFNGDETSIGTTETYIDVFNLMGFFNYSTNKSYFEAHAEHNFRGWILGKIPGVNKLNLNLVMGGHYLTTVDNKPYTEFSIGLDNVGIGKFRMLRLDLINSYHDGSVKTEIVVGLKFFQLLKDNFKI